MLRLINGFCIISIIFVFISKSSACLHFPIDYKDTLTEGKQEYFLYYDGQNSHMILRTEINSKNMPKELSWILPFPVMPSKFEELDPEIFQELYTLTPDNIRKGGLSFGSNDSLSDPKNSENFKIHNIVIAGNYQIQPIEILTENSGHDLELWLKKNNYNGMPYEIQKYYLKKGAIFLAIKMNTRNLKGISVKPLHIIYSSPKLSVPIKFTHETRTFDVDVYVLSKFSLLDPYEELNKVAKSFFAAHLFISGHSALLNKVSLDQSPNLKKILGFIQGDKIGYLTRFSGKSVNNPENKVNALVEDPYFMIDDLIKDRNEKKCNFSQEKKLDWILNTSIDVPEYFTAKLELSTNEPTTYLKCPSCVKEKIPCDKSTCIRVKGIVKFKVDSLLVNKNTEIWVLLKEGQKLKNGTKILALLKVTNHPKLISPESDLLEASARYGLEIDCFEMLKNN